MIQPLLKTFKKSNSMRCVILFNQKRKVWILKAVDRRTGRTIAWVLRGRDAATFQRLYDKLKHLTDCRFYADNWDAFAEVLPQEHHINGKAHMHTIEQDNFNTRHHLARMTRRTKVVSKSQDMVHAPLSCGVHLMYRPSLTHIKHCSCQSLIEHSPTEFLCRLRTTRTLFR